MFATLPVFTTLHLSAYAADEADVAEVQTVFSQVPSYVASHAGGLSEDLASRELADVTGRPGGFVFLLRRRSDERPLGFIDAVLGEPDRETLQLCRVVIAERCQRLGLGTEAYQGFESWVRREHPQVNAVVGSVKRGSKAGLDYWSHLGFHRTEMREMTWEGRTCEYWLVRKDLS